MRVPPEAIELEEHALSLRRASEMLLDVDGFDRWGPKNDAAQVAAMERQAKEAYALREPATAALARRVPELRASRPEVIEAWVDAHQRLLDDVIARTEDSTSRYVANEEKVAWERLRAGEIDRVHQNPYYIHYDRELYEQLFGLRG